MRENKQIPSLNKAMILLLIIIVALAIFAVNTRSAYAATSGTLTVSVTDTQVNIKVAKVGTSGTAYVCEFEADQYPAKDTMSGLVTENSEGVSLGKYTQGKTQTIAADRFTEEGRDRLYSKYYVLGSDMKTVLAGPFYATTVTPGSDQNISFKIASKKGATCQERESDIEIAKDLGISHTVVNINIEDIVLANEDAEGNPIDWSEDNVIPFESNGKTYFFSQAGADRLDSLIGKYTREGINVTGVVIAWAEYAKEYYPKSLLYTDQSSVTAAFNTSNSLGRDYWIATMEFLADRYSKDSSRGFIQTFVIGNEIDYSYEWNQIISYEMDSEGNPIPAKVSLDKYMEEYARTLRLANLAVKKYNGNMQVLVPLTKSWAQSGYTNYKKSKTHRMYNSYAPKDILDWLSKYEKARGDYNWGLAYHCYPVTVETLEPLYKDQTYKTRITGSYKTTPFMTPSNLELLELYLEQKANKFGSTVRSVYLTEQGAACNANTTANMNIQAANLAQIYYRAAHLKSIKSIDLFHPIDNSDPHLFGLIKDDGTKKPSYDVWKYVDKDISLQYTEKYLKYLRLKKADKTVHTVKNGKLKTWLDVMKAIDSDYDWEKNWDLSSVAVVKSGKASSYAQIGKTYTSGKAKYKVTNLDEVTYVKCTASKSVKSITVPDTVKIKGATYRVATVAANAFKGYSKARSITIGSSVKTLKAKSFYGASKLKTVTLKTKKLKSSSITNCFKGSKVTTVVVKVGTSKENKSYVKTYKKIFTKKKTGKAVTVK